LGFCGKAERRGHYGHGKAITCASLSAWVCKQKPVSRELGHGSGCHLNDTPAHGSP
jgi:hypothetical protein